MAVSSKQSGEVLAMKLGLVRSYYVYAHQRSNLLFLSLMISYITLRCCVVLCCVVLCCVVLCCVVLCYMLCYTTGLTVLNEGY